MKKIIFIGLFIGLLVFIMKPINLEHKIIKSNELDLITPNAITSSVNLFLNSYDQGMGSCSGVVIKNTPTESIVLTAKHCVLMKNNIWVEGLEISEMGVAMYDDLAYVKLNQFIPHKTPAKLSNNIPKMDDPILFVGYPAGKLYTNKGKMFIETLTGYITKSKIIPGCSGGGAFNTDGELIGIIVAHISTFNTSFLVKLQDIHKLVKTNKLLEE